MQSSLMRATGLLLAALLQATSSSAQPPAAAVEAVDGNLYVVDGTQRRQLTALGRDADPVLTPDGKAIVFTRLGVASRTDADASPEACRTPPDELKRIALDGSSETTLLTGRRGNAPEQMLCEFARKQFASDGRTLYFLSPAWPASAALHAVDIVTGAERYVLPANDVLVLSTCASPAYRDHLVVQQRRKFVFGGSFDWYWVFDPTGQREIGPIGEVDSVETILLQIEDSGSCR